MGRTSYHLLQKGKTPKRHACEAKYKFGGDNATPPQKPHEEFAQVCLHIRSLFFRGFSLTPNLSKEKRIEKEEEEQTVGELTSSMGNLVANRYDIRSLEWTFMILAFEKHLVWGGFAFSCAKDSKTIDLYNHTKKDFSEEWNGWQNCFRQVSQSRQTLGFAIHISNRTVTNGTFGPKCWELPRSTSRRRMPFQRYFSPIDLPKSLGCRLNTIAKNNRKKRYYYVKVRLTKYYLSENSNYNSS